jgi:hypothetical protein
MFGMTGHLGAKGRREVGGEAANFSPPTTNTNGHSERNAVERGISQGV